MPNPKKPRNICICCPKECKGIKSIYCSNVCQQLDQMLKSIRNNSASEKTWKRYILYKYGHSCFECKNSTWSNKPIPLELDHIDGNSSNNIESNLRVICPNCHAFTSTYKGRNKGQGRHFRMKRYHEGKSF
jgi:5-methylcytosine-specific restriction endonuclease McrA